MADRESLVEQLKTKAETEFQAYVKYCMLNANDAGIFIDSARRITYMKSILDNLQPSLAGMTNITLAKACAHDNILADMYERCIQAGTNLQEPISKFLRDYFIGIECTSVTSIFSPGA